MTQMKRREKTRVAFHVEAVIRFANDIFEHLAIKNLSLGGVYLEGVSGHSQGEKCEVDIFLTGSSSELKLNMAGKVAHQDDNGVGVQFEEMDIDTFSHLKCIVSYNVDEPSQVEDELVENISEKSFDE